MLELKNKCWNSEIKDTPSKLVVFIGMGSFLVDIKNEFHDPLELFFGLSKLFINVLDSEFGTWVIRNYWKIQII